MLCIHTYIYMKVSCQYDSITELESSSDDLSFAVTTSCRPLRLSPSYCWARQLKGQRVCTVNTRGKQEVAGSNFTPANLIKITKKPVTADKDSSPKLALNESGSCGNIESQLRLGFKLSNCNHLSKTSASWLLGAADRLSFHEQS